MATDQRTRTAPRPTGRTAPTEPPTKVDPAVQAALAGVEPTSGYALVRLVLAEERATDLGFPPDTEALLDAAMLRIERMHSSDDLIAREHPEGAIIFASLDGLAPLLGTYLFLLPLERIQGALPAGASDQSVRSRKEGDGARGLIP